MSFVSDKTQVLEVVGTPGCRKPSNFAQMISCGQEAYPVKS